MTVVTFTGDQFARANQKNWDSFDTVGSEIRMMGIIATVIAIVAVIFGIVMVATGNPYGLLNIPLSMPIFLFGYNLYTVGNNISNLANAPDKTFVEEQEFQAEFRWNRIDLWSPQNQDAKEKLIKIFLEKISQGTILFEECNKIIAEKLLFPI